jgi:hypothetical protein
VFSNPSGTGPDSVNGFGGTGGGLLGQDTSITLPVPPGTPPGSRQIRVIGLSAVGQPVGVFSDAVTVVIQ